VTSGPRDTTDLESSTERRWVRRREVGKDAGIDPSDEGAPAHDGASAIRPLPNGLAIALVTGTSGAVLVLEILAGRLLAPYVGVNLETYTAIIGTILAGIALGAWAGGIAADRVDPRGLIPLLLVAGGGLAIASIPVVRALGGDAGPDGTGAPSVLLALWGFGPSAAVLSAVPPAVVKLQLRSLERTGTTVGHLSAWGTGGAIGGTFLAGYVLVAYAAVTTLIVTVGVLLVVAGVLLWLANRIVPPNMMLAAAGLTVLASLGAAATSEPCDVQSSYYCISIEADPDVEPGRILILDDLRHSYVDLDDPTHLEFWYIRRIADAIDVDAPAGPIDAVALGAGGLTIPRWIRATRSGSDQVVLELDGDLVELIDDELPPTDGGTFQDAQDIDLFVGDGRRTMRGLPTNSADVIVGDAFGSRAVPWHLATEEFMTDVARVLRPGGIYVANIIDGANESFLRAETATMRRAMPHVAVMRGPGVVDGLIGNSVVVASTEPFDAESWDAARRAADDGGELVTDVDAYLDGALVLTDDFAPVDQLIAGVG
jgi:spermidine synthase